MNDAGNTKTDDKAKPASLADLVAAGPEAPSFRQSFPPTTLVKVLVLAGLFVALNAWQFPALLRKWLGDPNWSHGFIIPLFSLFLIYTRWSDLAAARRRVCLWGLPIILASIGFTLLGFFPIRTWMISHVSMIVLLFGLVLYLAGPRVALVLWVPIFYLIFAVPIPDLLYMRIAGPLQKVAAIGSGLILRVCGVEAVSVTESNITFLSVTGVLRSLTVVEACAGMRMLMAFLALGVAMAYVGDRPAWQKITLVVFAMPIAVLCNVIRVTITATMFVLDRPELGQSFMHTFTGLLMLIPALLLLWLLGLVLQALYVEVDEQDQPGQGTPSAQEAQA